MRKCNLERTGAVISGLWRSVAWRGQGPSSVDCEEVYPGEDRGRHLWTVRKCNLERTGAVISGLWRSVAWRGQGPSSVDCEEV